MKPELAASDLLDETIEEMRDCIEQEVKDVIERVTKIAADGDLRAAVRFAEAYRKAVLDVTVETSSAPISVGA